MGIIRYIILPLAGPYLLVVWARSKLYDAQRFRSSVFDIPVIGVGNQSTGGTGKSPMVEYLTRLISQNTKTAIISRGYRRRTSGYFEVKKESTVLECGDEPMQFKQKFGDDVLVAVDEKRVRGITSLLFDHPETDAIILDDVFQHRSIKPGIMIMLTTYKEPFFDDKVLPLGNLREGRSGYRRADIIVVTKCPKDLSASKMEELRDRINPTDHQKVFFTSIEYGRLRKLYAANETAGLTQNVLLVTGIANPQPLIDHLKSQGVDVTHLQYPDHYRFKERDIKKIKTDFDKLATSDKMILTTEKDAMRLLSISGSDLEELPVYYQEITTTFLQGKEEFDKTILTYVEENKGNHRVPEE